MGRSVVQVSCLKAMWRLSTLIKKVREIWSNSHMVTQRTGETASGCGVASLGMNVVFLGSGNTNARRS